MDMGNYVQLIIFGQVAESTWYTKTVLNSFVYRVTEPPSLPSDATGLSQLISNFIWPTLQPILHSDLQEVRGQVIYPQTGPTTPVIQIELPDATGAGTRLPLEKAVCVNLLSHVRGRNWNGRKLYGPVCQNHVTGDSLNSTGFSAYATLFSMHTDDANYTYDGVAYNMQPFIWSQKLTGDPTSNPGIGVQITDISICRFIANCRHRRFRPYKAPTYLCCGYPALQPTYTAVLNCPGIPALNGQTRTLTFDPFEYTWFTPQDLGPALYGGPYYLQMYCPGGPPFRMDFIGTVGPEQWSTVYGGPPLQTCPPLVYDSTMINFFGGHAPFTGNAMAVQVS